MVSISPLEFPLDSCTWANNCRRPWLLVGRNTFYTVHATDHKHGDYDDCDLDSVSRILSPLPSVLCVRSSILHACSIPHRANLLVYNSVQTLRRQRSSNPLITVRICNRTSSPVLLLISSMGGRNVTRRQTTQVCLSLPQMFLA